MGEGNGMKRIGRKVFRAVIAVLIAVMDAVIWVIGKFKR